MADTADGPDTGSGAGRADGDPSAGAARKPRASREPTPAQKTPLTQQIGRFAVGLIAALFGIFAVANAQSVEFDYLFGSAEIPLILILIGAFVLGGLGGWFATWRSTRRSARRDDGKGDRTRRRS